MHHESLADVDVFVSGDRPLQSASQQVAQFDRVLLPPAVWRYPGAYAHMANHSGSSANCYLTADPVLAAKRGMPLAQFAELLWFYGGALDFMSRISLQFGLLPGDFIACSGIGRGRHPGGECLHEVESGEGLSQGWMCCTDYGDCMCSRARRAQCRLICFVVCERQSAIWVHQGPGSAACCEKGLPRMQDALGAAAAAVKG